MDEYLRELSNESHPDPEERGRRRRLLGVLGIAGLSLVTLGTLTTGALFTDSQDLGANSFTTGTLVLGLNPTTALFSVANMAPGDSVSRPLAVTDAGTLGLRYAVTATATDPDTKALRDQLQFNVFSGVSAANCAAGITTGGTALFGPAPIGASAAVFGNPAQGAQPGDRTLLAAGSETLCFVATLPLATDNTFQNAATTVSFTFAAEQTQNNP
jgi:spore coat-associated protein N